MHKDGERRSVESWGAYRKMVVISGHESSKGRKGEGKHSLKTTLRKKNTTDSKTGRKKAHDQHRLG